jgi:hypothetical protein
VDEHQPKLKGGGREKEKKDDGRKLVELVCYLQFAAEFLDQGSTTIGENTTIPSQSALLYADTASFQIPSNSTAISSSTSSR